MNFLLVLDFLSSVLLHIDSAMSRNQNVIIRVAGIRWKVHSSGTDFTRRQHIFNAKPSIKHSNIMKFWKLFCLNYYSSLFESIFLFQNILKFFLITRIVPLKFNRIQMLLVTQKTLSSPLFFLSYFYPFWIITLECTHTLWHLGQALDPQPWAHDMGTMTSFPPFGFF